MARICKTCGTSYNFCSHCQVSKPNYDAETFCSKEHGEIFAILSKHGCKLSSADETLKELSAYNFDETTFTESIQAHIDTIKAEAIAKTEEPTVTVEPEIVAEVIEEVAPIVEEKPIVKQYNNKNNKKKKW